MEKDHSSGHSSGLLRNSLKKVLKLLPPTFPTKVYRLASKLPPLKAITNTVIRSFIPEFINIPEGKLLLNQKDVTVCGSLALGAFEKRELDTFRSIIKDGMTVVDIGANIGLYTVIASKLVGSNGKVFAYEPEQENFGFLSRNIEVNNFKNSTPLQIALSDKAEERKLFLAKDNKGHHSFVQDNQANIPVSVHTETLDSSLAKYGSPIVDVIKMDIEGAEPLALMGMKETITRNPNIIIFTEIFPNAIRRLGYDPLDFLKMFNHYDLSVWVIDEDVAKPTLLKPADFASYIAYFPKGEAFHNLYVSKRPL